MGLITPASAATTGGPVRTPVVEVVVSEEWTGRPLGHGLYGQGAPDPPLFFAECGGRLTVVLAIEEGATTQSLRDLIPDALRWRDYLQELQDPSLNDAETTFMEGMAQRNADGISYAVLVREINGAIIDDVCSNVGRQSGMRRARFFLRLMHCKDGDKALAEIEERVSEGRKIEDGFPFRPVKLRSVLRLWRDGMPHKLLHREELLGRRIEVHWETPAKTRPDSAIPTPCE